MQYVAGFLFAPDLCRVVLIKKKRPDWQKGRLNAVGGHIEAGETPDATMHREWNEEVECDEALVWTAYAKLQGKGFECTFFYAVAADYFVEVKGKTDEHVAWWNRDDRLLGNVFDSKCAVANVAWLVEMATSMIKKREKAHFFTIIEHGTNQENE